MENSVCHVKNRGARPKKKHPVFICCVALAIKTTHSER